MKNLYLIPARGGSKGLPGKNIKELNGKPLIYYSIDAARQFAPNADICISSDDSETIRTVEKYGLQVPFVRPDKLATDHATSFDVIRHALEYYENQNIHYDVVILLQPTSPFRKVEHIAEAINLFRSEHEIDMIVSVKVTSSNPYYVLFEEDRNSYLIQR